MSDHLIDFDRAGRITASIVGAILRHDPYHSRKWAWRVITGREPEHEPGWDIKRGLDHEEDAIETLEIDLGRLAVEGRFVPHPNIDWLGASPDAFIESDGIFVPVECKCPRLLHAVIPPQYNDQVQTQLECCDAPFGFFVSWVKDRQQVWRVDRDPEWWKVNYPELKLFYETYVVPDVEPPRSPRRTKDVKPEDPKP
jgi:hypothetical protein